MRLRWAHNTAEIGGMTAHRLRQKFGLKAESFTVVLCNVYITPEELAELDVLRPYFATTDDVSASISIEDAVCKALDGVPGYKLHAASHDVILLQLTPQAVEKDHITLW